MDIKKLVRNAEEVHKELIEMPNGSVVTKSGCKIYIPARYAERGMAEVGVNSRIIGIYAMVVKDAFYAVCNICAAQKITPTSFSVIKINGEDHYEFIFEAGSQVIETTDLLKDDTLVYRIYDELFSKGNVPWYFTYEDLGRIFDTAKYHGGANLGDNPEVTDLLVSLISRDPADRTKYYRTSLTSRADLVKKPPAYIPLKSVIYAATNTTNKLAGSYFSVGVSSALVSPSERTEKIEEILRR